MRKLKVLIVSFAIIFSWASIILGQTIPEVIQDEEVSIKDFEISEPKVLPGNPFYFLKDWQRAIRLFFYFQ